jgi:hypothetical protein
MAKKIYKTVAEILADGFMLLKQSNERLLDFHQGQEFIMVLAPSGLGSIATLTLAKVSYISQGYISLDLNTPSLSFTALFPVDMLLAAKSSLLSGEVGASLALQPAITIYFSQIYFMK